MIGKRFGDTCNHTTNGFCIVLVTVFVSYRIYKCTELSHSFQTYIILILKMCKFVQMNVWVFITLSRKNYLMDLD